MLSAVLCLAAFFLAAYCSRRSVTSGLVVVLVVGYFYGIVRAVLDQTFAHFIFDAAVLGFYTTQPWRSRQPLDVLRTRSLRTWVMALVAWPVLLAIVPIQDYLIQAVGLRGNVFLLPFVLVGAHLTAGDLHRLSWTLALLALAASGFAAYEFFVGVDAVYPRNAVTEIIYRSRDLAGFTAFRIPATFSSAHAYAGTMAMTVPLLIGGWISAQGRRPFRQLVYVLAIAGSILGIFMAGARSHTVVLFLVILAVTFSGAVRLNQWLKWVVLLAGIAWMVLGEERLQRFQTLGDTEYVSQRVLGSVNMGFFEIMDDYPLGNGLGGGGTSIPYFLEGRVSRPVAMESEYARILLEQGIPGLLLWGAFIAWLFTRRFVRPSQSWYLARRLSQIAAAAYFATGLIGVGLLTSVPQTCLLLLAAGWISTRPAQELSPRAVASPALSYAAPAAGYLRLT